jgi:hypothetical protein
MPVREGFSVACPRHCLRNALGLWSIVQNYGGYFGCPETTVRSYPATAWLLGTHLFDALGRVGLGVAFVVVGRQADRMDITNEQKMLPGDADARGANLLKRISSASSSRNPQKF